MNCSQRQSWVWYLTRQKYAAGLVCVCLVFYISIYTGVFNPIFPIKTTSYRAVARQPERAGDAFFWNNMVVPTNKTTTYSSRVDVQAPVSTSTDVAPIVRVRSERVKEICKKLRVFDSIQDTRKRMLISRSLGIAMCFVPKAGCTFWKRVFIALQHNTTDVFKLTKNQAHSQPIDRLFHLPSFDAAYGFLSKSIRVIFVRDPFSRLYSDYVDKFYLGDFWNSMGKGIIKQIRPNASANSLACGHDLTFEEFLQHALRVAVKDVSYGGDEHWFPITKLCHPCTFNYHIIGKQETFTSDRDYVMDKLGITSMINNTLSAEVIARDAMKQTIDMAWDKARGCLSRKDMAIRMWTTYVDQGYIDKSQTFPEQRFTEDTSKEQFLDLAMEAYRTNVPSSDKRKQQRREALVKAYSGVSPKTLSQIQEVYRMDFQLFDYPLQPDILFKT